MSLKSLDSGMTKNGFFFNKYEGYSISEIDSGFNKDDLSMIFNSISNSTTNSIEENENQQTERDSLLDIILKSDYAPAESEENRRKKKKK